MVALSLSPSIEAGENTHTQWDFMLSLLCVWIEAKGYANGAFVTQ